ncbi:MAG TPA: hypothetical protein DCE48_08830 [Lachnospiraceae bacterium]|uniref:hypothetical protein n=1 Tax=Anaerosporobacter sp. TaxID=1872529 RepID=UPI000EBC38B4|nr:hypothetical protein [Anaerosporobacter sp.]HAB60792.1 hypothetical protein [Lachnospiraceae bacterium]
MTKKELAINLLNMFFIITTLITIVMGVMGLIWERDRLLTYEVMFSPVIIGFISVLPSIVMYSKKELTLRQIVIRKVLHLFLLEIELIAFSKIMGIWNEVIGLPFVISILIVAVLVQVFLWLVGVQRANTITNELKAFQKEYRRNN